MFQVTFWQGALSPPRLVEGERAPLGGSPSWSQLSAPGRISAFCKFDSPFLKSLPAVYLPRVFYFYVFLHIQDLQALPEREGDFKETLSHLPKYLFAECLHPFGDGISETAFPVCSMTIPWTQQR